MSERSRRSSSRSRDRVDNADQGEKDEMRELRGMREQRGMREKRGKHGKRDKKHKARTITIHKGGKQVTINDEGALAYDRVIHRREEEQEEEGERGDYKEQHDDVDQAVQDFSSSSSSSYDNDSEDSEDECNRYVRDGEDVVDVYKVCACIFGGAVGKSSRRGEQYDQMIKRKSSSRILSIYDGRTEYEMYQWNASSNESPGFFVAKTKAEALRTAFPRGSKLLETARCLLRCRTHVKDLKKRGNNGSITTSHLKPVEIWNIDKVYPDFGVPHKVAPYWDIVHWKPSGIFK